MKKIVIVAVVVFAAFIGFAVNFCGVRIMAPNTKQNTVSDQEIRKEAEINLASSIITTDITDIDELQIAIAERDMIATDTTLIVGKNYALLLDGKNITFFHSVSNHIESKKQTPKKDDVGNIGAER